MAVLALQRDRGADAQGWLVAQGRVTATGRSMAHHCGKARVGVHRRCVQTGVVANNSDAVSELTCETAVAASSVECVLYNIPATSLEQEEKTKHK